MPLKTCEECGAPSRGPRCPRHEIRARPRGNSFEPTRQRIFARDDWSCQECGRPVTQRPGLPNSAHLDHYPTPLSAGGSDEDDNLRTLCRTCNLRRGAR